MSRTLRSAGQPAVLTSLRDGVAIVQMNRPDKLNAWTPPMLEALLYGAFAEAAADPGTEAVVLTGTGTYYCAGVDLKSLLTLMPPRALLDLVESKNYELFRNFLEFPKPIVAAVNGPAIGASVTSATLCDAVVASESATFSTPFAALALPAEGCSSVHFEALMGREAADRMLGPEGWRPTAAEARGAGLIDEVVPGAELVARAEELARARAQAGPGRTVRGVPINDVRGRLLAVNRIESRQLAEAVLSERFLLAQQRFLASKGKAPAAAVMRLLRLTRPAWALML